MVAIKKNENEAGSSPDIGDLSQAFRLAMRRIASSVAIVTARDAAGCVHGMAATAFASVSMDPPSMLVAVNQSAGIHGGLREGEAFCVNVLNEAQVDLIKAFSNTALRNQRFTSGEWAADPEGVPYLPAGVCSLFCGIEQTITYGTHTIFVGRVVRVEVGSGMTPLVWLAGVPMFNGLRT